jgi:Xaa-Pro dipeptidase
MSAKNVDLYRARIEKLKHRIAENDMNGCILAPGPNIRYYTGVSSFLLERPFLLLVPTHGEIHLVAPTLESGPYLRTDIGIIVHSWNDSEGPSHALEDASSQLSINGRWGVEGRVPFQYLHQLMKHARPELTDAETILQGLREIKEPKEVQMLQRAASILSKSFEKIFNLIKPGITEFELANHVKNEVYSNGAESVDDVLIQSGPMAADPHHQPSTKKIRRKESLVVDATCTVSGYFADITRTFMLGRDRNFEGLYQNVLEAQQAAIEASSPGVTVGSVDHAARERLRQASVDKYFIHRTGHGLGLEVHEAPYIIPNGKEELRMSMVFTVEPGAYVPRKMGVRIEDDVLVAKEGCKVMTDRLPKQFGWWK